MPNKLPLNYKVIIPTAVLALAGILAVFSCSDLADNPSETPPEKLRPINLGIATWAGFASGIVGMEKGYFDNLDVKTITLDDANARNAAFASGDVQIMISSVDLYAQESAAGVRGKILLVTDESRGGDGIIAKSSITSIQDLRGKRIAYAHGGPSDYFLFRVLESASIDRSEVDLVPADDPSRAAEIFQSGDVDAAVTWEPFLSNTADVSNAHILVTTSEFPEIIVDILVANTDILNDEALTETFVNGWMDSVRFIKDNPTESVGIIANGLGIPEEDVEGMIAGLEFADVARNQFFFNSASPGETRIAKLFDDATQYWLSIGAIDAPTGSTERISDFSCSFFAP